jgi:hypothetical protein
VHYKSLKLCEKVLIDQDLKKPEEVKEGEEINRNYQQKICKCSQ